MKVNVQIVVSGLWLCVFLWLDTNISEAHAAFIVTDEIFVRNFGTLTQDYTVSQSRQLWTRIWCHYWTENGCCTSRIWTRAALLTGEIEDSISLTPQYSQQARSWTSSIQVPTPQPHLMLSIPLFLVLPSVQFPHKNCVCVSYLSRFSHMSGLFHSSWLINISVLCVSNVINKTKRCGFDSRQGKRIFLSYTVSSSALGPN
jgi:hypothetical protein